jgi:glycosyltransferase involved in cell wall biosynthesis
MLALRKQFNRMGIETYDNQSRSDVDGCVLNSIWFDVNAMKEARSANFGTRVLHRVDGPIFLYRDKDRTLDDQCFALNQELANATIFQSRWSYLKSLELGYNPKNPYVVYNAVDPDVFQPKGRIAYSRNRKIRVISTSWSDNWRKGFASYQWLDGHLDWNRFDYTFVGRTPTPFEHIQHVPPQKSEHLADILRHHDIFITASQNDPASNAVLEALACGLPVIFLDSGGHPEQVGYGGLSFSLCEEIPEKLETLVDNYSFYQSCINVPSLDATAKKYLDILIEG